MGDRAAATFNFTRDVVERWAQKRPGDLALWCVDETGGDYRSTFAELVDRSRRAAHRFHQAGVRRGDRVLVMLPRVPMWWIGMLGLIRLGAVPIPATTLLTAKDIAYRITAADITAILTDADGAGKVGTFGGKVFLADELERNLANASPYFDPEPTRADDPGIIYFTSGTTGPPKMVLHTQESYGLGHRVTGAEWLCSKPNDVHWNLADTGWAKAAWSSLFGPWHTGACIFSVDARGKFDPRAALRILARYPITTWCAPPTALRLIVREDAKAFRFPHLRHCVSAGEPLNPEVIEAWKAATGLTIYEGYGQTETVVLIANLRERGDEVIPGSMGWPTPGYEVALLDDGLSPVPDGDEGEIAVRVAPRRPLGLFREYWRNPEENAARFRGDWYLTGDRARRDGHGRYWFVGRADDVIKSAGYRIGPFEVESVLIEHPDVVEAAVVAKLDDVRGAIVRAFVVLRRECTASDELRRELQEHCKRTTAPYKYPREIEFVVELPKTISGKIRRVELRQRV
jgi:acetyl-CoA synthetase/medium-chain acyl-CoA synthetase